MQFRQQVRWLGHVEGARGNEQDVVGLDRTMLGRDRGAFNQWQKIALHALAADVGPLAFGACADLVDLVEKHDAAVFDSVNGILDDLFLIEELVAFLRQQDIVTGLHVHAPGFGTPAESLGHHVGKIDDAGRTAGHAGNVKAGNAAGIGDLNFNLLAVQLTRAQFLAEGFAGGFGSAGADQGFDDAGFGVEPGLSIDILAPRRLHHGDAGLEKIANDLIDIATHITHFSKFGGFDLDEGRIG